MENDIPYGYCQCGCGQPAPIAKVTFKKRGWVKGKPLRFIHGHNTRSGEHCINFKGGIVHFSHKYVGCLSPGKNSYRLMHVLVAEKALGKPLPKEGVVHHVDEDPSNNNPGNLVICESQSYHFLLHSRKKALKECGHASWKKCQFCQQYDDPNNLYVPPIRGVICHRRCRAQDKRNRRAAKKLGVKPEALEAEAMQESF